MITNPTDEHREQARRIVNGSSCSPMFGFGDLVEKIASALSSRDTEVREVLEGVAMTVVGYGLCWCRSPQYSARYDDHEERCLNTADFYDKLQPEKEGEDA